jgi:putative transposase
MADSRPAIRNPQAALRNGCDGADAGRCGKVAKILDKHPATIYRWIDAYNRAERLSVLLRKGRSDRGRSRLSSNVNTIIEAAIKKIYLTAEQPPVTAVIEEVDLQCFKAKLKRPGANTVRRRIAMLSDRLKVEKRKGRKALTA